MFNVSLILQLLKLFIRFLIFLHSSIEHVATASTNTNPLLLTATFLLSLALAVGPSGGGPLDNLSNRRENSGPGCHWANLESIVTTLPLSLQFMCARVGK